MKRYLLTSLVAVLFTGVGFANPSLLEIPQSTTEETQPENFLEIDPELIQKNTAAAKFFAIQSEFIETFVVTYESTGGVTVHIAWYTDGCIMTAMNGPEEGKQVIICYGTVVGSSSDYEVNEGFFVHTYEWGRIYSYNDRQIVKFNE